MKKYLELDPWQMENELNEFFNTNIEKYKVLKKFCLKHKILSKIFFIEIETDKLDLSNTHRSNVVYFLKQLDYEKIFEDHLLTDRNNWKIYKEKIPGENDQVLMIKENMKFYEVIIYAFTIPGFHITWGGKIEEIKTVQ